MWIRCSYSRLTGPVVVKPSRLIQRPFLSPYVPTLHTTSSYYSTSSATVYNKSERVGDRRDIIRNARPFSDFLTDAFGREHDYLRISVTERCNLRCVYCMPEEGVPLSPSKDLLTTPEIVMLSSLFVSQGVTKIRLTGGEPTVRRDILPLMQQIGALRTHGLKELCLTTNGLSLHRKLDAMIEAGLTGVNLSLDTLDPWQFQIMTRRKGFDLVNKSISKICELNKAGAGIKLKINCVVMRGVNDREILPFVEMTRANDVEVRFIEYMPFDGNKWSKQKMFSYAEMLECIQQKYPELQKVQDHKNDTSRTWKVPGFKGKVGFITSMTQNFCGTCNRLRITGDGNLKVCLFGNAEISLRDLLRQSNRGEPILEAEHDWFSTPKGPSNDQELLDVIGMAVKRKKAKHAGLGELEHMKNRPMILIGTDPVRLSAWKNHPCFSSMRHVALPSFSNTRQLRLYSSDSFSTSSNQQQKDNHQPDGEHKNNGDKMLAVQEARLTHVSECGTAHMVSVAEKTPTSRIAVATCFVRFSTATAIELIRANQMKKGDVLGVARVAGIMGAKRTPDLIPLCHPVAISHASVTVEVVDEVRGELDEETKGTISPSSYIRVETTVTCEGKTGVEMEALTAASTAALTVYDMCKAVDKGMRIDGLRVVLKDGGKSGRWEMP